MDDDLAVIADEVVAQLVRERYLERGPFTTITIDVFAAAMRRHPQVGSTDVAAAATRKAVEGALLRGREEQRYVFTGTWRTAVEVGHAWEIIKEADADPAQLTNAWKTAPSQVHAAFRGPHIWRHVTELIDHVFTNSPGDARLILPAFLEHKFQATEVAQLKAKTALAGIPNEALSRIGLQALEAEGLTLDEFVTAAVGIFSPASHT